MKCYICDATLGASEIKIHPEMQKFEPCGSCLFIIGEVFEDGLDEDEISKKLLEEWGEWVAPETPVEEKA